MRQIIAGPVLVVRAIGGLHVVTLAWDFAEGREDRRDNLLGFAIEREELRDGELHERYFLRGIKRFPHKDEGVPAGTPLPTSEHPIQSFQWGDYTVRPGGTYRYRVIPAYGKPKLLTLDLDAATTVQVTTEREQGGGAGATGPVHDIFFNRGVAGSQAYARRFPNLKPDPAKPKSEPMRWLSRGLFEALTGFIRRAAGADAADYGLRAMLYEFQYLPVGEAFAAARDAGADVQIRYEAQSYREHNEAMIAAAGIADVCAPQKSRAGIRHNKFIVLLRRGQPVAVWTGSTNISAGGIFGHSNVGHAVWDADVASRYLAFWERLAAGGVTRGPLVQANVAVDATPAVGEKPPAGRVMTLFSPRDDKEDLPTMHWYAGLMRSTTRILCMTYAFNLDQTFLDVLTEPGEALRYAVFDKNLKEDVEQQIEAVGNSIIATGAKLAKGDLENFIAERLTGFNSNYYIHDKFLLVDPLGDDPIVVTGSANFSGPSQHANDENMLVIRGDRRVADIYFGEFMRIFDHFYSRYIVGKLRKTGENDPGAGFLKETAAEWVPGHFAPGRKSLRRKYFMGG